MKTAVLTWFASSLLALAACTGGSRDPATQPSDSARAHDRAAPTTARAGSHDAAAPTPTPASSHGGATPTPPGDDLRARCERLVKKAMQFGSTEPESTYEQKVEFCIQEQPPASFLDCVDRAQTKEETDACE